jgi:hypothetical protein
MAAAAQEPSDAQMPAAMPELPGSTVPHYSIR